MSTTSNVRNRVRAADASRCGLAPASIKPVRRERRDGHGRLLAALQALAGLDCCIEDASQRPWCSATFVGAQHRILLRLTGGDAVGRAAVLQASLPEADILVTNHIVVDVVVESVSAGVEGHVDLALAILTIEDW